jgi:subtilisin family serine protease
MRKLQAPWKTMIASLIFTAALWTPSIAHAEDATQINDVTGGTVRILVKVDPATQNNGEMSILSAALDSDSSLAKVGWKYLDVDTANAAATMQMLQSTQGIVEVTPDYPLELAWEPNDPSYEQGSQWALEKIGANVAWEFSSGQAITVAVIDSGIDLSHPDLAGRIVAGYNFVDNNTDTTDQCGHGTHVAGIIAADANNEIGVAGVANQAVIMPIKVIGANCTGSYSRLMQGILYAVDHGVRVISITSGGGFDHSGLHDAIIYAESQGVLVAVAAGNRASDLPFYPGSYEEAFTVAGTDANDTQYDMSNFGKQIDISAPAVDILSTFWNADKGSTYATMSGTSMAAPHVAAVAALILAIDPKLPLSDLEKTLTGTATDLGAKG